ncbi:uncharacterized protein [Asterias amurensis]|uniref:uncharacterized protein n=1 Tax=Asterias amurensis TaxID=7602 RepID=UPI003AB7E904
MDSLSSEDNDEESSNILRDTGHPSFKKVKRTRMNVDHLSEDEKHLRKKLLGRERARRYRERKRAVESFFKAVAGRGGLAEHKSRGVQQKRSCTRRKRRKLSRFASFSKEVVSRRGEQARSLSDTLQPSAFLSYPSTCNLEEHLLKKVVDNSLLSDKNPNPGAILNELVPTLQTDLLYKDAGLLNKGGAVSLPDRNLLTLYNSGQLSNKNMEVPEAKDFKFKTFSETMESSRDVVNLSKRIITNMAVPSGSKDDDELVESPQGQKKPFKQQNVKDFINLFPVEHSNQNDGKIPLSTCNLGMQRKVDCVNPVRRSNVLRSNIRDLQAEAEFDIALKKQMTIGSELVGGDHSGQSVGEPVESKILSGVVIPPLKPDGKTEQSQPQAGTSVPQATLSPLLPLAELPLPIVIDSTSGQPFAMEGLQFPQTHQNTTHMPGVMQQQMIRAVSNIHALNTLQASGQSRMLSMHDLKQTTGIHRIIGLANVQGVGGIHGVSDVQGILGNPGSSQEVAGLHSTGGIQGLLDGINGISGLQGISNLLGIGCLSGITGIAGPTSSTGLSSLSNDQGVINVVPSLQGMSNFQAAVQEIPALQGVTGLQGLVNLQTLSTLQGIQDLQGVGISALHGQQALAGLQAIGGALPLQPGFSVQAGTLGQLGIMGAVGQDTTINQLEVPEPASCNGVVSDPEQQSIKEEKEKSPTLTSSACTCSYPNVISQPDLQMCTPEKKQLYPDCKGRSSRRKQASPRCISKRKTLVFESKENSGKEEEDGPNYRWPFVTENMAKGQQNSTDLDTRLPAMQSTECVKSTTNSTKLGSKLSKKVEELLSATNTEILGVHVECPTNPVDDESPSPQTWRRFLERERHRNDRLREVEQQLAKLQVLTAGASPVSSKSFSSMTTQTYPQDFLAVGGHAEERLVKARTNLLWQTTQGVMEQSERNRRASGQIQQRVVTRASPVSSKSFSSMTTQTYPQDFLAVGGHAEERLVKARTNLLWQTTQGVMEQSERNRRASGQIQQRVVTSSGDPLDTLLALDVKKSEIHKMDSLTPLHRSEMLQQPSSDIEGRTDPNQECQIVNRPGNYWLHSIKRKQIACRKASPSAKRREGTGGAGSNSTNQEDLRELSMINEDPLSFVPKKKKAKKYVYQIPPENSGFVQAGEISETAVDWQEPLDCRMDNQNSPLQVVSDATSGMNAEQHHGKVVQVEMSSVLPWELEGLTKIERNRIRAREGMRRHREKLKMAKLSNQGWRCHEMPGILPVVEKTLIPPGSKTVVHRGYLSAREKKGGKRLKSDSLKGSRGNSTHSKDYMIATDVSTSIRMSDLPVLSGEDLNKKTFQVFTPVAAETESNITSLHKGLFKTELPEVHVKGLGKEAFRVFSPVAADATAVQTVNPGTHVSPNRRDRRRKGWLKSEQRFEKNATLLEMPTNSPTHSLPASDQIDFTQEPYRSMSLRERNRVRAREGMRRYRERLKMARQPSHPAHHRVAHMLPRSGRGTFKRGSHKKELDKGTVSVEEPSGVPREVPTKNPNSMVSYSEMVEYRKTEIMKRRRSIQLLKTNTVRNKARFSQRYIKEGTPQGESRSQGVFIKRETVSEEESEEHMNDPKLSHVNLFPIVRQREQGSTSNEKADQEKSVCEETQDNQSLATASSISIADEVVGNAEKERLAYIERMKKHLEAIRRRRRIDEKIACGMDRHAAISSSKCAAKKVIIAKLESEEDIATNDEETLCTRPQAPNL